MDDKLLRHIRNQRPNLDILGEWLTICTAKTAGKSRLRGEMDSRQIVSNRGWRTYRRVWDALYAPRIDEVFMFVFVRNPWDRVVSTVHFLQQQNKRWGKFRGRTFHDVVKNELAVHGTDVDQHFRPQAPVFLFRGEPIPNMFVGRFERLYEDWEFVTNRIGISSELPHVNKSQHAHYTDYYDDECREIVATLYAEEIAALDYKYGEN